MDRKKWLTLVVGFILVLTIGYGCAPTAKVVSTGGTDIAGAQAEAYNGPKARIAVARFSDKTGKGWWTSQIGNGMKDMLSSSLFNTNRFIVLEREILEDVLREQDLGGQGRISKETAAPIGKIEGAELLVTGAVTEFEPNASGGFGGIGGGGGTIGGILGSLKRAHIAIDVRVIDTRTSRIVSAVTVEGQATDIAGLGGFGGGRVGVGLGAFSKTPMEKAVRVAIEEAVKSIVSKTPAQYYHYQ